MLAASLIGYLVVTLGIGIWAARRVRNTDDFLLAGRNLPLSLEIASLFATWFGAETVLGASATMAREGMHGIAEDPLGAALCLFLMGAFIARKLYRLRVTTFPEFFRQRFGKGAEYISSIFMVISYLGWIAAQFMAIGVVGHVILPGVPILTGALAGMAIVVAYTLFGGMWSVSITDVVQGVFIVLGLFMVLYFMHRQLPIPDVLAQTDARLLSLYTGKTGYDFLNYIAGWMIIGLGSLPQQDLFQRISSAKSEKVAVRASYGAAIAYITIGLIPLLLALYARLEPEYGALENEEMLLPGLVMKHTPPLVQLFFFGALLSAIMSTASGAILAPAAVLSENMVKPFFKRRLSARRSLFITRLCVLAVALISMAMALGGSSIYELVGQSSALSLVSLLVPMIIGFYTPWRHPLPAIVSMLAGFLAWLWYLNMQEADAPSYLNPLLHGLAAEILGYALTAIAIRLLHGKGALTAPKAVGRQP